MTVSWRTACNSTREGQATASEFDESGGDMREYDGTG